MSGRVALATPDRRLRRNVIFTHSEKTYKTAEKEAQSLQQKMANVEQYIGIDPPPVHESSRHQIPINRNRL